MPRVYISVSQTTNEITVLAYVAPCGVESNETVEMKSRERESKIKKRYKKNCIPLGVRRGIVSMNWREEIETPFQRLEAQLLQ